MKLSKNFLKEYLSLPEIETKELAEAMTHVGNEYESITALSSATNLVIGYVRECEMHPDSDHLHVCQVEIKPQEVVQIVCGAPNVAAGQKVIVSLPGAELPGGIVIKKGTIRGQESNGMICSLSELGIESKYQSEEDKAGIHVLPEDAVVGEDPLSYLCYHDETIDFELTPNRGDLLSVLGMAYEVGAIYDQKVHLPNLEIEKEIEQVDDYVSVEVKTDKCPLYLARMVKNVTIQESPQWMKARLMASGIRPINNVVDISNYVMLEYGQPLHFFDYKTLGSKIIIRLAEEGEALTTLDGLERTLSSNDIVIANEEHAVGLAGVMGGLNSEVEASTKDIVIESAIFHPTNIRLTSKAILRSEASNRFEKGLDPNRTYMAIDRACQLLEKYANGTVIAGKVIHDTTDKTPKKIEITKQKINQVLGLELTLDEIIDVFRRLDFEVSHEQDQLVVTVPTRRIDLAIVEDLIEEVGRIHGIENVESKMPVGTGFPGGYEKSYLLEKTIRNHLSSLGLQQVRTYTLTSEKEVKQFTCDSFEPLALLDPMLEERKYLRYSLIPSLLQVANYNLARNVKDIAIEEISDIYFKEEDKVVQKKRVAGLLTGKVTKSLWQHIEIPVDFYYAKGIVENLLQYLGYGRRITFSLGEVPKEMHPYQSAVIYLDRTMIGFVGMVHPSLSKTPIYVFELDFSKLFETKVRPIKDREISKYPSISKDFAFVLDEEIFAEDVIRCIQKIGGRILESVEVFDVYQGEHVDPNKKSLAFNLVFREPTRTLNDEEVMVMFRKMIEEVENKFQGVLRDK